MTKDLYTVRDIAQQLDVAEKSVRRLISTGQLDAAKVCGKWVVTAENLKRFVDAKTCLRDPAKGNDAYGS